MENYDKIIVIIITCLLNELLSTESIRLNGSVVRMEKLQAMEVNGTFIYLLHFDFMRQ